MTMVLQLRVGLISHIFATESRSRSDRLCSRTENRYRAQHEVQNADHLSAPELRPLLITVKSHSTATIRLREDIGFQLQLSSF